MTIERPMFPPHAESVDSFLPQPAIGGRRDGNLTSESAKPAQGPSRRNVLAGLAVLSAGLPASAAAIAEPDPIFAAIERHKAAAAIWDAAVDVSSDFPGLCLTDEQREQRDLLDDAVDGAFGPLVQAGANLVNTAPMTLAGIVAAIQCLRNHMMDDGTYMPQTFVLDTGGDAQNTMGWIDAWLDTLADAAAALDRAGKAVQS